MAAMLPRSKINKEPDHLVYVESLNAFSNSPTTDHVGNYSPSYPVVIHRDRHPRSSVNIASRPSLVGSKYDRFCDDMELEFGPGIVHRLKNKFVSASTSTSGNSHAGPGGRSDNHGAINVQRDSLPVGHTTGTYSKETSADPTANKTMLTRSINTPLRNNSTPTQSPRNISASFPLVTQPVSLPHNIDGILSHSKLLTNDNVIIIERNGVYPPPSPPHQLVKQPQNKTLAAQLVNNSECIEGLVSQYKAIFEKDTDHNNGSSQPQPQQQQQRRKRSKEHDDPSSPPHNITTLPPSTTLSPMTSTLPPVYSPPGLPVNAKNPPTPPPRPIRKAVLESSKNPLGGVLKDSPLGNNVATAMDEVSFTEDVSPILLDPVERINLKGNDISHMGSPMDTADGPRSPPLTNGDAANRDAKSASALTIQAMTVASSSPVKTPPPIAPRPVSINGNFFKNTASPVDTAEPVKITTPRPVTTLMRPVSPLRKLEASKLHNTSPKQQTVDEPQPAPLKPLNESKPSTNDSKRNFANSTQDSPEFKRNSLPAKGMKNSPENRPEKFAKMSEAEAEKENSPRRGVTLKKSTGYGMTTIIDTKFKPIDPAQPALKIDDPSLLTSLKDLGRARPGGLLSGTDGGGDMYDIEIETMKIVIVGYNVPTGSKSSLKSSKSSSTRSHLRITFNDKATKTYEYPSERSLVVAATVAIASVVKSVAVTEESSDVRLLSLDAETDESDTDGIVSLPTVEQSRAGEDGEELRVIPTREGDLLRKKIGAAKALASYKPSTDRQFNLGVERPAFGETESKTTTSFALSNGTVPANEHSKPQWCVQSAADDENFTSTASDGDDLLF